VANSKTARRMKSTIFTPEVAELVALGAAFGANCQACFKYHYLEARKLGVSLDDMARAVELADKVKSVVSRHMHELSEKLLDGEGSSEPTPPPRSSKRVSTKPSKTARARDRRA
jgi:AhpD family alkylhydroperoxidase